MTAGRRESKARLGVFVVSGLVLAVAGALALGAARIFQRYLPLHCYFAESVQGLDKGSPISYRGVQLGRVSQVLMRQASDQGVTAMGHQAVIEVVCDLFPEQLTRFGGAAPSEHEVMLAIRREVTQGLRVRVAWKDITGQKYLDLDYVDPSDPEMAAPDLGFRPVEPYIPTVREKSFTDIQRDLATAIGGLSKIDYQAIAAQFQVLLSQLTQKVSDFRADEVSASIRDAADSIRATAGSDDLRRALARFDSISREIEELGRRANALLAKPELERGVTDLADAAKALRESADSLAKSIPETMSQLDAAVGDARKAVVDAKLPETTAAVRDGIAEVSGAARSATAARDELNAALRQMADASRSIARLADFLERHPESVLKGRDGAAGGGR